MGNLNTMLLLLVNTLYFMNIFTTRNRVGGRALAFLTAISMLISFLPLSVSFAQAAVTSIFSDAGPETIDRVSGYVSSDIDASAATSLTLSFDYDAELLDNNDVVTYGWRTNGGSDNDLGTIDGKNEGGTGTPTDEIGNVSIALPAGAHVGNLVIYMDVDANSDDDAAVITDIDVSDDDTNVVVIPPIKVLDSQDSVDICHSAKGKNYTPISPNVDAIITLPNGHNDHEFDIIPSFWYNLGDGDIEYPGKNWPDTTGRYENECVNQEALYGNLTVTKIVEGGEAVASGFQLLVDGEEVESGVVNTVEVAANSGTNYTVSEGDNLPNYELTSIVCKKGDDILSSTTENSLEVKVKKDWDVQCTILNTYNKPVYYCEDQEANNYGQEGECEYEKAICEIGENLLTNGSFEEPVIQGDWTLSSIVDWVVTKVSDNSAIDGELWRGLFGGPSHGEQNVELDSTAPTKLTQNVTTIPGATYELRFDFSPRPQTGLADNSVDALIDGGFLMNAQGDGSNLQTNLWTTHTENFVAAGTSTNVSFKDIGTPNGVGSLIDNAVLCLVKEPKPAEACELTVISDTTNTVTELAGANAVLAWTHANWITSLTDSVAQWIWGSQFVTDPSAQETQTFVKTFNWNGPVSSALLDIATDNTYSVTINGNPVISDINPNNFSTADENIDVASNIQTGVNTIEIAVTNLAVGTQDPQANPAGLLYDLTIVGDTETDCTYVPEEERGQLIVRKVVEGGELTADDFSFTVNDGELIAFEEDGENLLTLSEGTYDIVEPNVLNNYDVEYDNCTEVLVESDAEVTPVCTITNTYNPPLACEPNVELIKNGGFETPVVTHEAKWDIFAEGAATLEWLVDWLDPNDDATDPASLELHAGVNGWLPSPGGNQYAELDGDYGGPDDSNNGEPASTKISQTIDTIPGETYTLRWDFSARPNTVQSENDLIVKVEGSQVANNEAVGGNQTNWTSHSYSFVATDNETEISFADDGNPNSLGTFIDNVSLMCEPETPYGSYCGDGRVNQEWEQCEVGDEGCTNMCTFENQCSTLQLVKINLDDTDSASFDGKLYLGSKNNPIPAGTWFKWDELGDDAANDIADEVDGLAVERDQTNGLQLAFRGGNERQDLDIVAGSIELKNLENGVVTRYLPDALGFGGLENAEPAFVDIFDKVDMQNVNFDMRADTGDDSVTLGLNVDEEAIAECNPDNGDDDHTLTVTITGDGSGIVESGDGNISCDSIGSSTQCAKVYNAGSVVNLTATADLGSNFDNSWTVGAGTCVGNTTPCSVTMNSDIDLTAHFDLNNTITTTGGGGGGGRKTELTGGGSGNNGDGDNDPGPIPQVAGEQVSVVPFGAPNAGGGGTSPASNPLTIPASWLGMVAIASSKLYVRQVNNRS